MASVAIIVGLLCCWCAMAPSARSEDVNCPYFKYLKNSGENIVNITVPIRDAVSKLKVRFSYQVGESLNDFKNLSVYEDNAESTTKRWTILYRGIMLPKLVELKLNDVVMCSGSGYPPPSRTINLLHTFENVTAEDFKCGIEGIAIPLIYKGVIIPRGRYPWLVGIYYKEATNLVHKCGGSLVSQRIVITAAHCVDGKREDQILVWLGRHDLNSDKENGTVIRDVQRVRMHHDYNVGVSSDADIAMLTLKLPVPYSVFIKPVCIWGVNEPIAIKSNEQGLVAGWGMDEWGNMTTRYPKSIMETIVDGETCLRAGVLPEMTSSRTICAGNRTGSGPCYGDSGGGLMINRNGRWLLRGIVSHGSRSGEQCNLNEYVVYCDVAKHIDWVVQGLR